MKVLLSHSTQKFKPGEVLDAVKARLLQEGNKQYATVIELNELAN